DLAVGAEVSKRSPATSTTSTSSSLAVLTMLPRTATCSSCRSRPLSTLPTCQSLVCRIFISLRTPSRLTTTFKAPQNLNQRGFGLMGLKGRRIIIVRAWDRGKRIGWAGRTRIMSRPLPLFARAGGPGREREVDRERHRDVRLRDEHRARLGQRGPLALG